jgi:hypothetical protein
MGSIFAVDLPVAAATGAEGAAVAQTA